MGIFDNIASSLETKGTSIADYTWSELFPHTNAKSGVAVNVDTALRVSTVFACCRVLAEGVAQLPINLFSIDPVDGSKTPFKNNNLIKILSRRPNDWMTSFELRETMMFHAVLTGNAYAYIGWGGGEVQELIPLVPSRVVIQRNVDYSLTYYVSGLDGSQTTIPEENLLHIKGPSWNGYLGMDCVQLAREAIGLSITTEETHASLHANGAQPGGVLSVKGKLDTAARERLKTAWQAFQGGVANRFKTAVLDVDADWKPLAMTGVDSQHLETRRFQIEEVCRALRVFPQLVMHSDKTSTFASADAFFLAHVTHSLMPWIRRWEESIEHKCLNDEDNVVCKFNAQALLRGDIQARGDFYMKALGGARGETAYMTRNEVRALEDMNPIAGGDKLLIPVPAPLPAAGGTPPKSELLQFLESKYSPDQPRDDHGRFGSGSDGEHHLARVGATVAIQAIAGALHGWEGGAAGIAAGAAIGGAIAAFVEFGGADIVGANIIALVGPHVLPDWAHAMLVDHHENFAKSVWTTAFARLSDADKKLFCLGALKRLTPEQIKQLAETLVADGPKFNPNHGEGGRFSSGSGFSAASLYKSSSKTAEQLVAHHGAADFVAHVEGKLAQSTRTNASVASGGHVLPNGEYTPERQALHESVLKTVFNKNAVSSARPAKGQAPVLSVLGGSGGSGKSFITKPGGPVDSSKSILLDSDALKAALGSQGWDAALYHEEATTLLDKADKMAVALGVNVTHDATLKSMDTSAARMAQYEATGYKLNGYYVSTTPENAVGRALKRAMKPGGRYVPADIILGNTNNESNFDAMKPKFSNWKIYDNNGDKPVLKGHGGNG